MIKILQDIGIRIKKKSKVGLGWDAIFMMILAWYTWLTIF